MVLKLLSSNEKKKVQINHSPKEENTYCKLLDMIICIVEAKKHADDMRITVTIMNNVIICLIKLEGLACP